MKKLLILVLSLILSAVFAVTAIAASNGNSVIYGDADSDGDITVRDAARILKYIAAWQVTIDFEAADTDGNGVVGIHDAALVLQYLAGWDVKLGVDKTPYSECKYVIISRDPATVAGVLGISEAAYIRNLSGVTSTESGVYIDDNGYVAVAVLSKESGNWELGYIKSVKSDYDINNNDFTTSYDIATLAKYVDLFNNPADYRDYYKYQIADLTISKTLLYIVEKEDNVYTVSSETYSDNSGIYSFLVYGETTDGIIFSDNEPLTNAITADSDYDAKPILIDKDTVIIVIDENDRVGVRKGIQKAENSYIVTSGRFLSANSDFIVLHAFESQTDLTEWSMSIETENGKNNSENIITPPLDFVIISREPTVVASVLGISEEEYTGNLSGVTSTESGIYIDYNGYMAIAALSKESGNWELSYIKAVVNDYDDVKKDFTASYDIASLANFVDLFAAPYEYNNYPSYQVADRILNQSILAVVKEENGIYTVAPETYFDGTVHRTFYVFGSTSEGIIFSDSTNLTNAVTSDENHAHERIPIDEDTVIIVIDENDRVGVRKGIQKAENSYIVTSGRFLSANSDFIVLHAFESQTDLTEWGQSPIPDPNATFYMATPDTEVEIEATNKSGEYLLTVNNVYDLQKLTVDSLSTTIYSLSDHLTKFGYKENIFLQKTARGLNICDDYNYVLENLLKVKYPDLEFTEVDSNMIEFNDADTINIDGIVDSTEAVTVKATVITDCRISNIENYDLDRAVAYDHMYNDNEYSAEYDDFGIGSANIIYDGKNINVWRYPIEYTDIVTEITEPTEGILDNYILRENSMTIRIPKIGNQDYVNGYSANVEIYTYAAYKDGVVYLTVYKLIGGTTTRIKHDYAIVSDEPAIMAELLGISEELYFNKLTDGLYISDNGNVNVAKLNTISGEWELIEVESYEYGTYDYSKEIFSNIVDISKEIQKAELGIVTSDYSTFKSAIINQGMLAVRGNIGNVYALSKMFAAADYGMINNVPDTTGLIFSDEGPYTNRILVKRNSTDKARIALNDDTIIVVIDENGNVGVRKGIQKSENSIWFECTGNRSGYFYSANSELIVLLLPATRYAKITFKDGTPFDINIWANQ